MTRNIPKRYNKVSPTLVEAVVRNVMRKIRESVNSDDALYQHIADCIKKDLQQELIEYRNLHRERTDGNAGGKYIVGYDHNLYDKVEVSTYIRYKPDDSTLIFGTIYSWFEHEYDFLIGCGVGMSALVICHVDDNMRAVDKPKPFPIDINRLNELIGGFDSETDEEDIETKPF